MEDYHNQSAYFGHQKFSIFTASSYFRPSETADFKKVPIAIVSEAKDQSRIASFSCVLKVIDYIKERMPLLSLLHSTYECSAQFWSLFTFVLLSHLHSDKDIEWDYNEAHYGKGSMDGIGGAIKNKMFQEVKSGRIVVHCQKDFAMHANRVIQSFMRLYLPKKNIFEESTGIEDAPYIKRTLDVRKVKTKRNNQGTVFLEFYRVSFDEKPFYTNFYRKSSDSIVCGHESFEGRPNRSPHCLKDYHVGE